MPILKITRLQFHDLMMQIAEKLLNIKPEAIAIMLQERSTPLAAKFLGLELWLKNLPNDEEGLIETLRYQLNHLYEHGQFDFEPIVH